MASTISMSLCTLGLVASYSIWGSWSGCVVSSYALGILTMPHIAPGRSWPSARLQSIHWDSGPHGRHSGAEPTQYDAQ
ncbi:hypothetical protein C8R47DRAFT_1125051, partial [Mycena vitilis]